MDYLSAIGTGAVSPLQNYQNITEMVSGSTDNNESFETLFQSALNMIRETNDLTNMAQQESLNFAMGYTDNLHDLLAAQQKANISFQYTAAVRNSIMDAYKEIMNLQF